jgi:hypothetical protein
MNGARWPREVERCRREIAEAERQIKSGHPDVAGLCLALSDWSAELRMILKEERRRGEHPAAEVAGDVYLGP